MRLCFHCSYPGLPPLPPSASSRQQFSALQQHIDELTDEKMELMRGLQQQVKINEALTEENSALAEQYNAQGKLVDELQAKVGQGRPWECV